MISQDVYIKRNNRSRGLRGKDGVKKRKGKKGRREGERERRRGREEEEGEGGV